MTSGKTIVLGVLGALSLACSGGSSSGHTGGGGTTASAGGDTGGGGTITTGGDTGSGGDATSAGGSSGSTGDSGGSVGSGGGSSGSPGAGGGSGAPGAGGGSGAPGAGGTTASGGGSGSSGSGGTVATGGTTGSGGRPSGRSAGCDMAPPGDEPIGSCLMHDIAITGLATEYVAGYAQRTYGSTIPKGYNPSMAYPLVIYGPGCGGESCESGPFTGRTDVVLVQATKAPLVYNGKVPPVPPAAAPGCFQTGVISTVDSPELNYFDQVVAEVESKYCIDKARVFVSGSSSGSWFSHYLACARGNVIRGVAADSGGIPVDRPPCTGGAGVMTFPGNEDTATDQMGRQIGAALTRDLFIKTNGCNTTPTQMKFGNATCNYYGGCSSPVVYCPVCGGHQCGLSYLNASATAFWNMLN